MNREEVVKKLEELFKESKILRNKWCKLMTEYNDIFLEKIKADTEYNNFIENDKTNEDNKEKQGNELLSLFLTTFECNERKEEQEKILSKWVEKVDKNQEEINKLIDSIYTDLNISLGDCLTEKIEKGDSENDTQRKYKM